MYFDEKVTHLAEISSPCVISKSCFNPLFPFTAQSKVCSVTIKYKYIDDTQYLKTCLCNSIKLNYQATKGEKNPHESRLTPPWSCSQTKKIH